MNAKRWTVIGLLGVSAGLIWATGYADWGQTWLSRIHGAWGWAMMLLPLFVLVVCGALIQWCQGPAALLYGGILAASGAVGIVRDERLFGCACCASENLIGSFLEAFVLSLLFSAPLVGAAWGLGRLMRRVFRGREETG